MHVVAFKPASEPRADEFEEIFREHYALVYRTAYSVTGSAPEAEDVLQTVFLQLLRSGLPPDFRKNAKGYLHRAAVNQALNAVRARRRLAKVIETVARDAGVNVPSEEPGHDADLQRRLMEAVATLNPRALEMVVLRYRHNCSEAEIAQLFGTSRSVVAVTLWRARARLKRLLRSPGE